MRLNGLLPLEALDQRRIVPGLLVLPVAEDHVAGPPMPRHKLRPEPRHAVQVALLAQNRNHQVLLAYGDLSPIVGDVLSVQAYEPLGRAIRALQDAVAIIHTRLEKRQLQDREDAVQVVGYSVVRGKAAVDLVAHPPADPVRLRDKPCALDKLAEVVELEETRVDVVPLLLSQHPPNLPRQRH